MRALDHTFDSRIVAEIEARLSRVADEAAVAIPWAIESGSRAWGFPSPDSDYDCRFFYVRGADAHLSPWTARDVIETPLDAIYDVNGWDLAKAVRLACDGNATIGEWLRSPFVYQGSPRFRDALLELTEGLLDPARVRRHYLHVGRGQWARSGARDGDVVSLKKVFYAVRPAAALHWMDLHGGPIPPMNLIELLDSAPPPPDVRGEIDLLIEAKAVTRELGPGRVPAGIRRWVEGQLDRAADHDAAHPLTLETRGAAVAGYADLVRAFGP